MENLETILNKYKTKRYFFFNNPRQIDIGDYQRASDEIVTKLSQIKDVSSIYNLTEVGVPGISDLDLMIILKNDFESSQGKDYARQRFSKMTKYTLTHPLVIQREDLFSKLYYRYYYRWADKNNTLRCVYGKRVEGEEISEEALYLHKLYYLAGILLTKLPRDFVHSLISGKLSARGLLQVIYTLRFSVILLNQLNGQPPKNRWVDFSRRFGEFRKQWFLLGKEREQMLVDYLIEATVISFELVEEFRKHLEEKGIIPAYSNPKNKKLCAYFTGYKFHTIFYDHRLFSLEEAIELNFKLGEQKKMRTLLLPSEFAVYLGQLSKASEGERSSYINRNLVFMGENPRYTVPAEIKTRERLFNEYIDFLLKGKAIMTNPGGAQELLGFCAAGSGLKDRLRMLVRSGRNNIAKHKLLNYFKSQEKC